MSHLPRVILAGVPLLLVLSACGGGEGEATDGGSGSTPSASEPSASASTSDDAADEDEDAYELIDVESEAKNVGFDIANYAIDQDFTNPADQAEFEANVDTSKSLRPGSEAGYEPVADNFRVCVTHFEGDEARSWAIYDGKSGLSEGDVGAPADALCP